MERRRFITLALTLALILVCSAGALIAFNATRMLPRHSGILYVSGLSAPVEVIRDSLGVPHIYASTVADLFFAQGYVHAQDRWWQMEFQRHLGRGRITELTGYNPAAVSSDLRARTWGWNRASQADADALPDDTRAVLEAYTAGINAYIGGKPGGDLALEYTLLGLGGVAIPVEPWTALDTAAWAKVMAWSLGSNADREVLRMALIEALGADAVEDILPAYPFDQRPTILSVDDLPPTDASLTTGAGLPASVLPQTVEYAGLHVATTLAGGADAAALLPAQGRGLGSNNWVISGSNTASGAPLLANDPHLVIQMPSLWYQIGLHCRPVTEGCPFDVVGFGFPGTPAVVVGHNARIAWGVTNVDPDVQDLYIIRTDPDDPYHYEVNGEWRAMEVISEVIHFGSAYAAGQDDPATAGCEAISGLELDANGDLAITVRLTHFGPIVTDNQVTDDCRFVALTETTGEQPLALRWTGLEPGDLLGAMIDVNRAGDWAEFRQALSGWDWPAQNFVYADTAGNIGYQTPGKLPIRAADHSGLVPVPGWTDAYEWRGYIPYDLLPRVLNPARGWIVTANNAVVPPEYYAWLAGELGADANYTIDLEWDEGWRAQRITDLVSATRAHTVATMAAIQGDNHSLVAEEMLPTLLALQPDDPALADAIAWLLGWNLQSSMDSPQAALFEVFTATLQQRLWADQVDSYIPGFLATAPLLADPGNAWWDDITTPETETRDTILLRALDDALTFMTETYGADRDAWRWGDLHTATFVSAPLGQSGIGLIERLVNAGPVRTGGSTDAVNATGWQVGDDFTVRSLPSFRMIVDLGDLENSLGIHTTGQSGHPLSAHYRDMIEKWRQIMLEPLRFGEEAVSAAAVNRLELRPAPVAGG